MMEFEITKTKAEDFRKILMLENSLSSFLTKQGLERMAKDKESYHGTIVHKKSKLYKASKKLSYQEKVFVLRLIGEFAYEGKTRLTKRYFKNAFLSSCVRKFVPKPNFDIAMENLMIQRFIDTTDHYIFNRIPIDEMYEISEYVSKNLLLKRVATSRKLNELELSPIHISARVTKNDGSPEVIGYISGYVISFSRVERFAEIDELAVMAEYRRVGIGSSLVQAFEIEAKLKGASTLFVATPRNNDNAIDFYERIGYKADQNIHFEKELVPFVDEFEET